MKHFKLTDETIIVNGITLHRIEATIIGYWGEPGTKGGYIEKESNLSDNAWVYGNAQVYGNAWVSDYARVYGDAKVYGDAWVYGNAEIEKTSVEKTSDYMTISSLGQSNRTITITFSNKMIVAGCFRGTLDEFKTAVDKKYNGKGNYYPTITYIESLFKL